MSPYGPGSWSPHDSAPVGSEASRDLPPRGPQPEPLAAAALIVCIAAFVLGLIPLVGAVLGVVGIVLVVVAARRGHATKRSYAGALAAAVASLTSVATTIALVGFLMIPDGSRGPEPAAAPTAQNELEQEPEPAAEDANPATDTSSPDAEDDSAADEEGAPEPTADAPDATPSPESSPTQAAAPDRDVYEELDERSLALIVKAPDDHIGRQVVLYGTITQLDAATGPCFVRISIAHAPQDAWYDYEHNSVGFAGDGEFECPVLDPFVADDEVKLWVTVGGSISYDTQIGGNTTVPAYLIDDAELK